ncbi:GNAT family N-acetyltransferase [Wenxinia marina]|uniref:Acetyltransferase n=1 Tax=Wenxinia marina DSM 24838 TaxID=1123501 RepID=A0A0D0NI42_9RHOB|nr:GNAT family N-acetyltransferase [Wenxinia marina]KIQ68000.1 Acetyltransferase [Wenxinia marina DSM 24838]GGL75484.1 GNAT family acetyltransferase [Wenxinia marina]
MLSVEIPTLRTERLILRAPTLEDSAPFMAFIRSDRARFVGGHRDLPERYAVRAFGHIAGLWVLRGYSSFVVEDADSGRALGLVGPWFPQAWPEPEFSWSLWHADAEGRGFVAEAMATIMPWFWDRTGLTTAISVIDEDNYGSIRVAERLGAVLDEATTETVNLPGSVFHEPEGARALVYRHHAAQGREAA